MISPPIRRSLSPNCVSQRECGAPRSTIMAGYARTSVVRRYTRRRKEEEEEEEEEEEPNEEEKVMEAPTAQIEASRVCVGCGTSITPLWRSGPCGPKSLCNACGIRYRKKRKGGSKGDDRDANHSPIPTNSPAAATINQALEASTKVLGEEELRRMQREKQERVLLLLMRQQKQQQQQQQQKQKLLRSAVAEARGRGRGSGAGGKEVAEAALLLMSLSSGIFVPS